MRRCSLAAIFGVLAASGASAQDAANPVEGNPREVAESRWIAVDTTSAGGIRHATLDDYLDVRGYRFLWLRVSRPSEPFLHFARMVFDCRRGQVSALRHMGVRHGEVVSEIGPLWPIWMSGEDEPQQRRLVARVCALPARGDASVPPGHLYQPWEIDRGPELLHRREIAEAVRAEYPPALRERADTGTVVVAVTVLEDGTPDSASITVERSTDAAFDEPARRVVRRMRFSPARSERRAVRVRIQVPIGFAFGPPEPTSSGPARPRSR